MGQSPPSAACSEGGDGLPFIQGNAEFGTRYPGPRLCCSAPTRIAELGDLLLSVRAPVGELNEAATRIVIGRGLSAIRFSKEHRSYAWHALTWSASALNRTAQGSTFVAVCRQDIENLHIPWFGEENTRIASVLDSVDAAIAQTEAVIAKLKQFRSGLLHDLLTCGLDEQGQLRNPISHPEQFQASPMGRIPREWLLFTVADVGDTVAGGTPARATQSFWGGDVPWITPTDMTSLKGNYISGGTDFITNEGLSNSAAALLPKGAVVVTTRATLGLAAVASRPLATNQGFKNVIPSTGWDSLYLCHVFRSLTPEMIRRASGTTFLEISATEFRRLCFAAPRPRSGEQERIARCAAAADSNVSVVQDECHKLKSLKSGLMTDLLSGRVRVPESVIVMETPP